MHQWLVTVIDVHSDRERVRDVQRDATQEVEHLKAIT